LLTKNNFENVIRKYGVSVLFPGKDKKALTLIQGRLKDIEKICNEFNKIINRKLQILEESDNKQDKESERNVDDTQNKITHHSHSHNNNEDLCEVLFFHPFHGEDDEYEFNNFLEYLMAAQHTIDICVFTITDDRIKYVLDRQKKNGVKIRVITDNSQALTLGADAKWLHDNAHIPVKVDFDINEESHMHHKFCVIDEKIVMTGSFNWTRAASSKNHENILITNNKNAVKQFKEYFEQLWSHDKSFVDLNVYLVAKSSEVTNHPSKKFSKNDD